VTEELIKIAPQKSALYQQNRGSYIKMLSRLERSYGTHLRSCKLNRVILNHNSLGYLAQKYHFDAEALSGLSPEANPSPNDIKRVLQDIKKEGITTIFYEEFINNKAMQAISQDAKVQAEALSPLGNITADEAEAGLSYEQLMYKNLEKLSRAMFCN